MKRIVLRRIVLPIAVMALALVFTVSAAGKGSFDGITVQAEDSEAEINVSDPALLGFFAFTDFEGGTRHAPNVSGPALIITRWSGDPARPEGHHPWDRLHYYHSSPKNSLGRGWVYYDGLINGSSEYDGKWFPSTRNADALMEGVAFSALDFNPTANDTRDGVQDQAELQAQSPPAVGQTAADNTKESIYLGAMGIAAAMTLAAFALRWSRLAAARSRPPGSQGGSA